MASWSKRFPEAESKTLTMFDTSKCAMRNAPRPVSLRMQDQCNLEIRQARQVSGIMVGEHEAQSISVSQLFRGLLPPPDKLRVRFAPLNTSLLFDRDLCGMGVKLDATWPSRCPFLLPDDCPLPRGSHVRVSGCAAATDRPCRKA